LNEAVKKLNIDLVSLVAETAIWASPEVHTQLQRELENAAGAFFPRTRRCRGSGVRRTVVDNEYMDDNTLANLAIKAAIGVRRADVRNYATCHIWPNTSDRSDCHTVIANLVLLPRPLAGLSDYFPDVVNSLKYRAFELYQWHPPGMDEPIAPENYPTNWRETAKFSEQLRRKIEGRALTYLDQLTPK
jgi:hypothetical protein